MSESTQSNEVDFSVDANELYREDIVTDLKAGTIRCFRPIKLDGSDDDSRSCRFVGHTQLMSPQGPVPIHGELEGDNLAAAIESFPAAMEKSFNEMVERVQQMQEQAQRDAAGPQIITPGG